jgi:hypothetical protein
MRDRTDRSNVLDLGSLVRPQELWQRRHGMSTTDEPVAEVRIHDDRAGLRLNAGGAHRCRGAIRYTDVHEPRNVLASSPYSFILR